MVKSAGMGAWSSRVWELGALASSDLVAAVGCTHAYEEVADTGEGNWAFCADQGQDSGGRAGRCESDKTTASRASTESGASEARTLGDTKSGRLSKAQEDRLRKNFKSFQVFDAPVKSKFDGQESSEKRRASAGGRPSAGMGSLLEKAQRNMAARQKQMAAASTKIQPR